MAGYPEAALHRPHQGLGRYRQRAQLLKKARDKTSRTSPLSFFPDHAAGMATIKKDVTKMSLECHLFRVISLKCEEV